jgi:hypothetical protein
MTQNALGGHAIPTNTAGLALLVVLDAVSAADAAKNRVPGLERAIAKNKGPEFASLLHQFAVDFSSNPQSSRIKSIVSEIDATAKERLPKKAPTPPPAPALIRRVPPPTPMIPGAKPPGGDKSAAPKTDGAPSPAAKSEKGGKEKEKSVKPEAKKGAKSPPTPKPEAKPAAKSESKSKSAATGLTRKKPK